MRRRPPESTFFPYETLFRSPEGRVDRVVDHLQLQAVALGDGGPVVDRRPAQGVDPQAQPGPADRLQVDHRRQVVHVRSEEHTSELQSRQYLVCRLLLEKKKK